MDYGIIFLIIIVIVIIIAIILIIYANRNNTRNLLLTLPNYRIQNVADKSYLALINLPNPFLSTPFIPIYNLNQNPFIPFWFPLATGGLSVTDPLGLWKIDIIKQISVNVAEIKIINDVYLNESRDLSLGFLATVSLPNENTNGKFTPVTEEANASNFIMTTIAPNTFTLTLSEGNLPIIIDKTNNFFTRANNVNVKPTVFKLTLI
jgi:hypothetical protein